jgi:peptide/nickel transport system substrate-binding protein
MRQLTILLTLVILAMIACAQHEYKFTGESGGTLTIGTTDLPTRINPLEPSMFSSNEVLSLLFLRLHEVDPKTGRMKPVLAESWEFSEDLKSITYYLRNDVKWWDGQPVTALDVLYTYQQMTEAATNYPNVHSLRAIKNVEVLNVNTIKFTFDKVYADILTDSDIMPVPKHVYEAEGEVFGNNPVGNGPYKIKEWVRGRVIVLIANDQYYLGRPPIDEIQLRYYADTDEMRDDFAVGDLDLLLDITPTTAQTLRQNENVSIYSQPGESYLYVAWNQTHPFLKDREVREALGMAINKQRILDEIYLGMGEISVGPLTSSSWGYDAQVVPVPYDVDRARKILQDKGFGDFNRNGILDMNRREFALSIITNSENIDRSAILRFIADDLRRIGVRVIPQTLDANTFISALLNRQFDGFVMGWRVGDKIDPTLLWSSEGKYNLIAYENKRVDSLIEYGVSLLDRRRAREVWREFQRLVHDDQPYTFLVVPDQLTAVYKRVKGIDHEVRLASASTYWIPEAERRVSVAVVIAEPQTRPVEGRGRTPPAVSAPVESSVTRLEEPPAVLTPERILEAAALRDTGTAVAVSLPPAPPTPSVITRAEPIKRVEPEYPAVAAEFNASGTIVVRVLVGSDGLVKEAKVMKSFGNPACERAALDAARQWQFTPATKDGLPFEQRVSIPFAFAP